MEMTMAKQPLSDPIPLRIPTDVLADIERIAKASDRTRSWVMVRALRLYLAGEGADILNVIKGREAIAEGDVHDMDDVLGEIEEIVRGKVA
jgi:predicted transcriptional regulator